MFGIVGLLEELPLHRQQLVEVICPLALLGLWHLEWTQNILRVFAQARILLLLMAICRLMGVIERD